MVTIFNQMNGRMNELADECDKATAFKHNAFATLSNG